MSATSMSTAAGLLKRIYGEYTKQQNLEHRTLDIIAKSLTKYNPGGEGYFGSLNVSGNESVGAINELEQFRDADPENHVQHVVKPKSLVAPIEFSGLVAKAADEDKEAFANAVIDLLDQSKERLLKDENRQFFGKGDGSLATVSVAASIGDSDITVSSAQYLRAKQRIDIFNGLTKIVDSAQISKVNKSTGVITLSAPLAAAVALGSVIVKENIRDSAPSDGKEMMGLRGIVDDGTEVAILQTVDAATYDIWRSTRIDASASLTSDMLQQLCDDVNVLSGEEVDTLITHQFQRRKYLDIVTPDKRFMDLKMDAGYSKLSFNGMEMHIDQDCQPDTVYGLCKKFVQKYELAALEMGSHGDSGDYLRVSNYDKFQAYWRHYCNFGTTKRNALGKIVNLTKPSNGIA